MPCGIHSVGPGIYRDVLRELPVDVLYRLADRFHGIQYWGDSSPGGSTGKLVRKEKRLHANPYAVRDVLLRSDNGTVYDVAPS